MIDENLKPWVIEVNHRPSFGTNTPLDLKIKQGLVLDTLNLIKSPKKLRQDMVKEEEERL